MTRTRRIVIAPDIYSQATILATKQFIETGVYTPLSQWIEQRLWHELGQAELAPTGNRRHFPRITLPSQLLEAIESKELTLEDLLQNVLT